MGAKRICPLVKGDELAGSELSYKKWIGSVWTSLSPLWGFSRKEFLEGLKVLGLDPSGTELPMMFQSKYKLVPCSPDKALLKPPMPLLSPSSPSTTTFNQKNPFVATIKETFDLLPQSKSLRRRKRL